MPIPPRRSRSSSRTPGRFLGRWLRNVRAEQGDDGCVPIIVPMPRAFHEAGEKASGAAAAADAAERDALDDCAAALLDLSSALIALPDRFRVVVSA